MLALIGNAFLLIMKGVKWEELAVFILLNYWLQIFNFVFFSVISKYHSAMKSTGNRSKQQQLTGDGHLQSVNDEINKSVMTEKFVTALYKDQIDK